MSTQQNNSNRFSPRDYSLSSDRYWLYYQCKGLVHSCRKILKFDKKVVQYSNYIYDTVPQLGMSSQVGHYCSSQGSQFGDINDYFSSPEAWTAPSSYPCQTPASRAQGSLRRRVEEIVRAVTKVPVPGAKKTYFQLLERGDRYSQNNICYLQYIFTYYIQIYIL